MATEVKNYHIMFYGGPEGHQNNRVLISLYDKCGNTVGRIRFCDPEIPLEPDTENSGVVELYMPSSMFLNVVDTLRNEKPIYLYFVDDRGFLTTSKEPVGEGED